MNRLNAVVKNIQSVDNLNIVSFEYQGEVLTMMSLDLADNIQVRKRVELTAKATNIAIAKEFSGEVSYSNQIKASIVEIENGELLSSIKLKVKEFFLESIITLNSSKRMDLKVDDEVTLLIKASDLSIV